MHMTLKPSTQLIHTGRDSEGHIVAPAIHRASTITYANCAALDAARCAAANKDGMWYYGTRGTASQWALSEAITALEPEAAGTMLYPSGLAAVTTPLLQVLRPGDHLLMVENCYDPTMAFCKGYLQSIGVETSYYSPRIGADVANLIRPNTRVIFLESPGSLTMEVQDVPAIVAVAKRHNILTMIDNTWATPLYLPALGMGVDYSIMACTKYISGHSDTLMGSVTCPEPHYTPLRRFTQQLGLCVSPDDAWLALRGMRTMALRLAQHEANSLKIAHWLEAQAAVGEVFYPPLPSSPDNALYKRDFKGAGGLLSFTLKGADHEGRARFIDSLQLFSIGYSWGGFDSLALPSNPQNTRGEAHTPAHPMVRLSIGLEDAEDLIADLAQGLAAI
jgi:cysteine-S-conjugate beta-lyase